MLFCKSALYSAEMKRIVITGIGLVTPIGHDVETVWQRLLNGESGVDKITLFDASNFPTKIAAEVKGYDVSVIGENPKDWELVDRHTQFAAGAGFNAMVDAGLWDGGKKCKKFNYDSNRIGVYTGAGEGQQDFFNFAEMVIAGLDGKPDGELDMGKFIAKGVEILNPVRELEQEPHMPATHLAAMFEAFGPNANCLTACAASAQAVGEAAQIIKRGEADIMLAGGAHSMIHPFGVTGFNLLTALSTNNDNPKGASKPFDKERDGFILGEGAAVVILEDLAHAAARGAKIYGELAGYGASSDAYRITDMHPEGRGAVGCIQRALTDAGLSVNDIDYINAHGTSTTVNDRTETLAIKTVFGDKAKDVPVSSTKSVTGHLVAAAGASELIYCLLAMRDKTLPPTINYSVPDPYCDLDYVPNVPRKVSKVDAVLSNSFGFGGQNVTLAVKRFV
ncbi:MAG: beta-ketoacyl-[acyl-carrier-protein] synthase family protein [Planctomycetaceae bacterium]|jgi:3-oxoacyl-[acyl-carrier-protein] synthase II|nr:beta-ketoacyl-[acyl-carrier-protein] synthase family protein [Planctomycetaceae bacterium]